MLDETAPIKHHQKPWTVKKGAIDRVKKNKTLNEVKPVEDKNENFRSFLETFKFIAAHLHARNGTITTLVL